MFPTVSPTPLSAPPAVPARFVPAACAFPKAPCACSFCSEGSLSACLLLEASVRYVLSPRLGSGSYAATSFIAFACVRAWACSSCSSFPGTTSRSTIWFSRTLTIALKRNAANCTEQEKDLLFQMSSDRYGDSDRFRQLCSSSVPQNVFCIQRDRQKVVDEEQKNKFLLNSLC